MQSTKDSFASLYRAGNCGGQRTGNIDNLAKMLRKNLEAAGIDYMDNAG